jgi:hypothetical protein
MRHPFLLPLVLTCASASAALAQQPIVFAEIPWGTPGDSARARVEAQGFSLDSHDGGR